MSEEEIIDILENVICDEVIGTYCIEIQKSGVDCSKNCEEEDCFLIQAIEGIIDLYNKEKQRNKEIENKNKSLKKQIKLMQEYSKKAGIVYKDKIKEKIEEKQNKINKLHPASDCVIIDDLENQIKVLQELLED